MTKQPVYLKHLYRVATEGRFARPGIGAVLITNGLHLHLSKLEGESAWYIDFAGKGDKVFVNNGWGFRNSDYGEQRQVDAIREDIGQRLDEVVSDRKV